MSDEVEFPIEDQNEKIVLNMHNIVQSIESFKDLTEGKANVPQQITESLLQTQMFVSQMIAHIEDQMKS